MGTPVLSLPPDNTRRHARFREVGLGVQSEVDARARARPRIAAASRRSVRFFSPPRASRAERRGSRRRPPRDSRVAGHAARSRLRGLRASVSSQCVGSRRSSPRRARADARRAAFFKSRDAAEPSRRREGNPAEEQRRMRLAQRQRSRRRGDGGGCRGFASAEAERIRRQTRVHRETISSASARSTETTVSSAVLRFCIYDASSSSPSETRDAPRRRENATAFSSSSSSSSSAV